MIRLLRVLRWRLIGCRCDPDVPFHYGKCRYAA